MTSVPPTQPPAAPQTDVRLTEANREAAMVTIRRDNNGTPTVWCDPCLAPLIESLNAGGIPTVASCCGHNGKGSDGQQTDAPGWVMLRDGRTLTIAREQAR